MIHRSVSSRSASPHLGSVFVGALSGAIAATIVVLVLLSGFGLAPPRVFGNPLGVDGAPVRVQVGGDSRTATAVGSVRGGANTVVVALSLTAASTPPLPSGSSVELAFGGGSGTIGF